MAVKPKTLGDIKLQQETIRNMQRRQITKKPKLSSKTLAPMSTEAIQSRRNQVKKPQLKSQTRTPMSPSVIKNRKNELKKPQLADKTKKPMSTEAIQNRNKQLKKPKLNPATVALHKATSAYSATFKKTKKFDLKNPAGGVKGGPPKKTPQLKPATKKPMNPLIIKDRKNKLKKPQLKDVTKKPMSTEVIKNRRNQLKRPKLTKGKNNNDNDNQNKSQQNNKKKPQSKNQKGASPKKTSKPKKPALSSKTKSAAAKKGTQKYPALGFLFKIKVDGFNDETSFKEASGLSVEREIETIVEGGNNDFAHRVPKGATKYSNLILKRGLMSSSSKLGKWCLKTLQTMFTTPIEPKNISVELQDVYDQKPIMTWSFSNAWPVKWEASGLDSQKSEIVIESLEFAFSSFTVS